MKDGFNFLEDMEGLLVLYHRKHGEHILSSFGCVDFDNAIELRNQLNEYLSFYDKEKDDLKQFSDKKAAEIKPLIDAYDYWKKQQHPLIPLNTSIGKCLTAMYEFMVMQHFKKDQE